MADLVVDPALFFAPIVTVPGMRPGAVPGMVDVRRRRRHVVLRHGGSAGGEMHCREQRLVGENREKRKDQRATPVAAEYDASKSRPDDLSHFALRAD
jgi:hypothetical protein